MAKIRYNIGQFSSIQMTEAIMLRIALIAVMAISTFINLPVNKALASELAEPVLVRGTNEDQFRTKLRECAAENGVNFNHHFTLCSISVTGAQPNFLIDRRTGKVTRIMDSELGIEVSPDSDILVVNPFFFTSPGDEIPSWLWRQFYRYDSAKDDFILVEKNQKPDQRPVE